MQEAFLCPACNSQVSRMMAKCPNCRANLPPPSKMKRIDADSGLVEDADSAWRREALATLKCIDSRLLLVLWLMLIPIILALLALLTTIGAIGTALTPQQ